MADQDHLPERFGPFILLRALGVGGMGSAFLALHQESDSLMVVKRMHPELIRDPGIFKRFVHEAEVAAHVQHPNVAALVAMGTIDGEPFLATEFVFGIQVSQVVERVEQALVDPIPLDVALFMAVELVRGVEAIHEARHRETGAPLGLIHRDVGARNVLVGFDGRVRLIDLGLGKSILSDWQTAHEVLAGSPDYMPPEQAMGARVDGRADVYGAAVTIWELLAGKKRIREESVGARLSRAIGAQPEPLLSLRPDASTRLEAILKTAMAPDPERRTPTAQILRRTLEEELRSVAKRATHAEVRAWLDAACATIIARDRRILDEARALAEGPKRIGARRPKTELFVGRPGGLMGTSIAQIYYAPPVDEPEAAPAPSTALTRQLDHARSSAAEAVEVLLDPLRLPRASLEAKLLLGSTLLAFLILVSTVTVVLLSRRPPQVLAEPLPAPAAALVAPEPEPEPEPEEEVPLEEELPLVAPPSDEPKVERAPEMERLAPDLEARKRTLLNRIKQLRKTRFDLDWQKRLTRLSARLSQVRSTKALDEIEAALRKMERDG